MNNDMTPSDQNQKIQAFLEAFREGHDAWRRAGAILVELVDSDPHVYNYIQKACPAITPDILGKFESMGRGLILPALAMDNSPGSKQLQRLPLSVQERFAEESIPVVVLTDEGVSVLLVKYQDLTTNQAKQVFRNGRLATEGEQRAWIEDFKLKARAAKAAEKDQPWELTRKELIVGNVRFNAAQLASFVAQLTK